MQPGNVVTKIPDHEVLVVGAGLAGMATAAYLQRDGVTVDVVERAGGVRADGAGIVLHPNAMAPLARLDADIDAEGHTLEKQVTTAEGVTAAVHWEAVWGRNRRPLAVHRPRLAKRLERCLRPDTVRWNTQPTAIQPKRDVVTVTFTDGTEKNYRVVIGADGVHSWVRTTVAPEVKAQLGDHVYWRFVAPSVGVCSTSNWQVWRQGVKFVGVIPLGHNRTHVFCQTPARLADLSREPREQLRVIVNDMGPAVRAIVDASDQAIDWHAGAALTVALPQWVAGRVALVGDAAHAMSPAISQGGAMAIEDAAVLGSEVKRHGATREALSAYFVRRRDRVRRVERMAQLHLLMMEKPGGNAVQTQWKSDPAEWYRFLYRELREPVS